MSRSVKMFEGDTKAISVTLPLDEYEYKAFLKKCIDESRPPSMQIRHLIRQWLAKDEEKGKNV